MEKPKFYLETTLFNYYFDSDRDAHADTVMLFSEIAAGKFTAYTSNTVLDELTAAPEPKRGLMLALMDQYPIQALTTNDAVDQLVDLYIAEGIVPAKYWRDGVHIAVAAVNGLDFVVSMNFQHIVRPKVKHMANQVHFSKGYHPITIVTPKEMIDENIQHH